MLGVSGVAVLLAVGLLWPHAGASSAKTVGETAIGFAHVNRPAPAFDLAQLQARGNVRLSALHGRPIVINFWSSTCEVCKQETPAIVNVARRLGKRVAFLGIDTIDLRSAAIGFAAKYHVTYPLAFDPQGSVAGKYGLPGLPETFFLSSTGKRIVGINLGALTVGHLTSILHNLYGITG